MRRIRSAPSATEDIIQFKVLLPRELHQRLAAVAEHGIGEEVRRRLAASFTVETDPDTLRLAEAIKMAAPPEWSTQPRAFAVLRSAVRVLLGALQPPGEALGGTAAQANIAVEGAMRAGRALGALGIPMIGEFPSVLDLTGDEP